MSEPVREKVRAMLERNADRNRSHAPFRSTREEMINDVASNCASIIVL